ncbi:MAG: hypothetical protein JWN45_1322 [Acidobacteriaceae bacterium]|nr:hypothetical protein [Acidobacteriaceae bacterium]
MPIKPLSAVESIRPAVDRTEKFLFEPFRWARWWRLALLGLATGEFASQGGCNFRGIGNLGKITRPESGSSAPAIPHIPGIGPGQLAALITIVVVLVVLLAFVHLYVASVARFMFFDTVATGRSRLREGWSRWHSHGVRYFLFQLAFGGIALAFYLVLVGPPLLLAWRMGIIHHLKEHLGIFLFALLILLPLVFVLLLIFAIIALFAKDFAVPIIALEDITIPNAWRKLWAMVKAAKGDFAIYVLMKIAMAIVVGIVLAIIDVIVFIILAIPFVILAVIAVAVSPGTFQSPVMIALLVTLTAVIVLPVVLFVLGVIAAPAVMFYESYALSFFGSRYEPLWNFMHPEPPPGTPASEPPLPSAPESPPPDMPPDALPGLPS